MKKIEEMKTDTWNEATYEFDDKSKKITILGNVNFFDELLKKTKKVKKILDRLPFQTFLRIK